MIEKAFYIFFIWIDPSGEQLISRLNMLSYELINYSQKFPFLYSNENLYITQICRFIKQFHFNI